jgi:hypothetical protein
MQKAYPLSVRNWQVIRFFYFHTYLGIRLKFVQNFITDM